MKAEILNIGDELLIGQVVNTNASWMAEELNKINVQVTRISVVADKGEEISRELGDMMQRADLVLITGGLGPTKDDITKKVLADHFNVGMVTHQETLDRVVGYFKKRGIPMAEVNRGQALVLEGCEVIVNEVGTAPCMVMRKDGATVVSMPGVPFEMKWLMTNRVLPMVEQMRGGGEIIHKTIGVFGIPESTLAEKIAAWESSLPEYIRLAYLPKAGIVRLRFSAIGSCRSEMMVMIERKVIELKEIIGDNIFTENGESLSEAVGRLLALRGETVATAESCTAGLVAHRIVETAGASQWLKGGVVAYSNEIKESVLAVPHEMLMEHGAVSEEVARAMAEGAMKALNTEWAVSTTGISGPGGGSAEKPVGLVYIAVARKGGETYVGRFVFATTREQHQERATNQALFELFNLMK